MAPQLENIWSSYETIFRVTSNICCRCRSWAPNIFHSKDNFCTRKKEMVGMILDGSWMRYYRWKLYQDENCVQMNTCCNRKMSRMKTF